MKNSICEFQSCNFAPIQALINVAFKNPLTTLWKFDCWLSKLSPEQDFTIEANHFKINKADQSINPVTSPIIQGSNYLIIQNNIGPEKSIKNSTNF